MVKKKRFNNEKTFSLIIVTMIAGIFVYFLSSIESRYNITGVPVITTYTQPTAEFLSSFNSIFVPTLVLSIFLLYFLSKITNKYQMWVRVTIIEFSFFAILALVIEAVVSQRIGVPLAIAVAVILTIGFFAIVLTWESSKSKKKNKKKKKK